MWVSINYISKYFKKWGIVLYQTILIYNVKNLKLVKIIYVIYLVQC